MPADRIVTVLPDTEHTDAVFEANTNAAVEAPGVAEIVKVAPGE